MFRLRVGRSKYLMPPLTSPHAPRLLLQTHRFPGPEHAPCLRRALPSRSVWSTAAIRGLCTQTMGCTWRGCWGQGDGYSLSHCSLGYAPVLPSIVQVRNLSSEGGLGSQARTRGSTSCSRQARYALPCPDPLSAGPGQAAPWRFLPPASSSGQA